MSTRIGTSTPGLVRALLVVAAIGGALAGCGGEAEPEVLASQSSETPSSAPSSSSGGGLQAEARPGTTAERRETTTSTTAEDGLRSRTGDDDETTTSETTTNETKEPSVNLPDGSEEFTDLEGEWLMSIDPSWRPSHGTIQDEVELWFLPGAADGFSDNVNVLTQPNTLGVGIERYLDISLASAESVFDDFELLDDRFRTGSHGQQQGVLEYTATLEGMNLHFYQVLILNDDIAVIATVGAPVGRFDDRRDEVVDHMGTLRFLGT